MMLPARGVGWAALACAAALFAATGSEQVPSEREKAGLRGPVKSCLEQAASGETQHGFTTITDYDREGRVVSRSSGEGDARWTEQYTHSPEGRLLKIASGRAGGKPSEQVYSYDDAGRLTGVSGGAGRQGATKFAYDSRGRKTEIWTAGPKEKNVAYAASRADGSDEHFTLMAHIRCEAMEACARVETSFDERGRPREAQLLDAEGQKISRLVREFDDKGNVTAERQVEETPELAVPPELKGQLNAAQLKSLGKLFGGAGAPSSSYVHDAEGRLTEARSESFMTGLEVRTITYNEHGDIAGERTTRTGSEGFSGTLNEDGTIMPGPPSGGMPPEYSETRYSYRYDSYGNWIEKKVEVRAKADGDYRISGVWERELTYYAAPE